jgi:N-acetylated-alpha-linked acidic dipeptidase
MSFSGDYGVYHSMYDDYYWMTHFGDPGMRYTKALDRIWARIAVDLASSPLVPLDYETYAAELKAYLEEWAKPFDPAKKKLRALFGLVEEMRRAAAGLGPILFCGNAAGATRGEPGAEVAVEKRLEANRLLLEVERDFGLPEGIPNRSWFKHLVFGTRSTYAALLLPELTEAAEAGNEQGVEAAIAHLESAVRKVTLKLKNIAGILGHPGA